MNEIEQAVYDFQELCELGHSGTTPKNYAGHVRNLLVFVGNPYPTQSDVVRYNVSILRHSYSYRNVAINAIKKYFTLMLSEKLDGIAKIRPPKQRFKPKVYDVEEIALKIKGIPNTKHESILSIALCCWLRKGEVLNIKVDDINGSLRQLHIKQSKGCKDRVLPITKNTLETLRRYYKEYRPKEYLFEGQNGGKYGATSCDKILHKHINPNMRFHSLRASGAYYALKNGADIKSVSEMLGHASIETTKYYMPTIFENIKQAI